jgi:hypothetical protein
MARGNHFYAGKLPVMVPKLRVAARKIHFPAPKNHFSVPKIRLAARRNNSKSMSCD